MCMALDSIIIDQKKQHVTGTEKMSHTLHSLLKNVYINRAHLPKLLDIMYVYASSSLSSS